MTTTVKVLKSTAVAGARLTKNSATPLASTVVVCGALLKTIPAPLALTNVVPAIVIVRSGNLTTPPAIVTFWWPASRVRLRNDPAAGIGVMPSGTPLMTPLGFGGPMTSCREAGQASGGKPPKKAQYGGGAESVEHGTRAPSNVAL